MHDGEGRLRLDDRTTLDALMQARVGMCLLDADLRYVWVNRAFSNLLGYPPSELIGMAMLDLTHPDDVGLHTDLATQVYRGEIDHFSVRKRFLARDGTAVACDVLATGCFDLDGRPIIGVGIQTNAENTDPTARRIETLQRTATIGQLAASAVHELRNSLSSISLASESLQSAASSDRAIELIRNEIDASLALLRSMAAFGSPSNSISPATSSPTFTVAALIDQIRDLLRLVIPASLTLTINVADDVIPEIEPREFQQVLINLILNARDAAVSEGGEISIAAAIRDSEFVDIAITDNGIGMPPGQLDQVFEPYFTTKGDAGTGLGLPICKEIVERHGGTISVESALGHGSTFTVRLPTWQASEHERDRSVE